MGAHRLCTARVRVRFSCGPPFSVEGTEVALLGWHAYMSGSQAIKELDHSESGVGSIPTDTNLV